jgi:alkylation response protein AidB-like acyl-CoA dehydrogenase
MGFDLTDSELIFEDCIILRKSVGPEGNGFMMAMQTVEWDRSALSLFVGAIAFLIQRCSDMPRRESSSVAHCLFQGIKHKLADMKIFLEAARSLVYRIAWQDQVGC